MDKLFEFLKQEPSSDFARKRQANFFVEDNKVQLRLMGIEAQDRRMVAYYDINSVEDIESAVADFEGKLQ